MKIKKAPVLDEDGVWGPSAQDFRLETEENGSVLVVEGDRGCHLVSLGASKALKKVLAKALRRDENYDVLNEGPRKAAFTLRRLLTEAGVR